MISNFYGAGARSWEPVFAAQLFALNPNTTEDHTTGNDLSAEMKTYYEKRMIELAEPELIHDQFADKYPIPKGNGIMIEFRKFDALPKISQWLSEGVTPNGQKLNVSSIFATVRQYGGFVTLTDMLELTAIDNMVVQATKAIASQAGRSLDTITREVINGGTNVIYAPKSDGTAVASRAAIDATCLMTLDVIRDAVLQLRRQNARRFDGAYIAIIHPDVSMDVRKLDGWIDVVKYGDPQRIYNGEIGRLEGVRFIENTEAKIFGGAGASSGNVYSTLFVGEGAYATTEVTGGGLQHIVKQKGSAGTEDPLDQRSTVGWKASKVSEILVQQYMVRVESSSSKADTAIIN